MVFPWGLIRCSPTLFAVCFNNVLRLAASSLPGMWRQFSPSSMPCHARWISLLSNVVAPFSSPWLRRVVRRNWRLYVATLPSCPSRRSKSVFFHLVSVKRIVSVILVRPSSSGGFRRQTLHVRWRRSKIFCARASIWVSAIIASSRRRTLGVVPSPLPPFLVFFDGRFGAPVLRRHLVPRAPSPSPTPSLAEFLSRRRSALEIGPAQAPSFGIIFVPLASCDTVEIRLGLASGTRFDRKKRGLFALLFSSLERLVV